MSETPYKKIMLKLSGEMLGGSQAGVDGDALNMIAGEIAQLHRQGLEVSVVIGGGNMVRGTSAVSWGIDRASADYMGMLATVINGLAIQGALENKHNIPTRVLTAMRMQELAEPYIRRKAVKHLEKGRVIIFAGGTGNPYFTTDTAAALRAREIGAEVIMKATKVDGVYDRDPVKFPDAKRFDEVSYLDVIQKKLNVMDATAITMCMEAKLPILIFKLDEEGCVRRSLDGSGRSTLVH